MPLNFFYLPSLDHQSQCSSVLPLIEITLSTGQTMDTEGTVDAIVTQGGVDMDCDGDDAEEMYSNPEDNRRTLVGIGGMEMDGQDRQDGRNRNDTFGNTGECRAEPCEGEANGNSGDETQNDIADNSDSGGIESSTSEPAGYDAIDKGDHSLCDRINGQTRKWPNIDHINRQEGPKRHKTGKHSGTMEVEAPKLTRWERLEEDIFVGHVMHLFKHKLILVQVDTQMCNLDMTSKIRPKLQMKRKVQAWGPQGETLQFVPACHVRVAFEMV